MPSNPNDISQTRRDLFFITIAGLLILAAGIGLRDPWPPDESRLALIARDMVLNHQWFFPIRAGEYYSEAPPLFLWCIAAFYWLTGSLKTSFLLPTLLAGLTTLLLVYDLGRRLWNRETGIAAVILLMLTLQFPLQAKTAQIDGLLVMWTTLAVYGFARHIFLGPNWSLYFIAAAATGFGVLTKGVGFLPWLIFIPYAYVLKRHWAGTNRPGSWRWILGPLLALAVIGAWLLPMLIFSVSSDDPALLAYRDEVLWGKPVHHYIAPEGHGRPIWYYVVQVIPWLWMPVVALLPWLIPAWRERIRLRDSVVFILLSWAVIVVAVFHFVSARRGVYLLPALPVLVLAAAPFLQELARKKNVRRLATILTLIVAVAGVSPVIYLKLIAAQSGLDLVSAYLVEPWAPLITIGIAGLCIVLACRVRQAVTGFAIMMGLVWMVFSLWLSPLTNSSQNGADLMSSAERIAGPDQEMGVVRYKDKFLLFATRPVTHFGYKKVPGAQELYNAIAWLDQKQNRVLLLEEEFWKSCFSDSLEDQTLFASRRLWHLADSQSVLDDCRGHGDASSALVYTPPFWPDHPYAAARQGTTRDP